MSATIRLLGIDEAEAFRSIRLEALRTEPAFFASSADNPAAIRFYHREGFSVAGRIPSGFLHEGREIDDVIMVKRIAD
ncbi:hypothetical protein CN083_19340 [Sinorhizobium meliloti]|uniref:GNAT family N-acetyltransferase n=1 Tax=Rhizobium meliloti TaxID=382 RepID=UPI000FDAA3B7|nr:hypothetical protein [Sinorhizobium meliloti]RVP06308.1 hypothetical protein CN083_19340 [Sinorhizobium meliloti]